MIDVYIYTSVSSIDKNWAFSKSDMRFTKRKMFVKYSKLITNERKECFLTEFCISLTNSTSMDSEFYKYRTIRRFLFNN